MVARAKDEQVEPDEGLHPDEAAVLGKDLAPNGKSIADRAKDGEHEEDEDDGTNQLVVPGTGTKLSTTVGGKKPTESFFKMRGVALAIAGNVQIPKDTELWIAVPVAIDDVHVQNRRREGQIVGTKLVHTATAIGQPVVLDKPPVPLD